MAASQTIADSRPLIDVAVQAGPIAMVSLDWPADCGGEACFVGRTRIEMHSKYGSLIRLEYEVYGPMVLKLMRQMAQQAVDAYGCRAVRLIHAHGAVCPGQASIVIQTATPHREHAFAACRWLIDTVKQELPIWKRQVWLRGQTYVQGCCAKSNV